MKKGMLLVFLLTLNLTAEGMQSLGFERKVSSNIQYLNEEDGKLEDKTNQYPTSPFESALSKLPTTDEMDKLIARADEVMFDSMIEHVGAFRDSILCQYLVYYLFELLKRTRQTISSKKSDLDRLIFIIETAKLQQNVRQDGKDLFEFEDIIQQSEFLQDILTRLRTLMPGITKVIDKQYYSCFGEPDRMKQPQTGEVTYIMERVSFQKYVSNAYQSYIELPEKEVHLARINIYPSDLVQNGRQEYPEFTCLAEADSFGSGKILRIKGQTIIIGLLGGEIEIYFDFCTRVEVSGSTSLPSVGMHAAFRGVRISSLSVHAFMITCW